MPLENHCKEGSIKTMDQVPLGDTVKEFSIEFTNECNFRCPICPHSSKLYVRPKGYMSKEVFVRSVQEADKHAKAVTIGFFGEQLLHLSYVEYIKHMKHRNYQLIINTNMSLVDEDVINAWIDSNVDEVRIGMDAITIVGFDRCIGRKCPSKDNRVKDVIEKIKYWLGKSNHRKTRLIFTRSQFNTDEEKPFIDFWKNYIGPRDMILSKGMISYGGIMSDPSIKPGPPCNIWDIDYCMIGWDGTVSPCNLDVNLTLSLGNVMNRSIQEMFTSEKATILRSKTGCGRNIEPCRTCIDSNNWRRNKYYSIAKKEP